jgi:hypothetical protein
MRARAASARARRARQKNPPALYSYTKGKKVKIDIADRTPRETLEKRLDKTPSSARCFAQGSSLMC